MPIDTVNFKGQYYPEFQTTGFASRFVFPFAQEVCKGRGVDVGCNRIEWSFPNSIPIDPLVNGLTATTYQEKELDYVFSSHCLEHIPDWVGAIEHWICSLKSGGVLFLYLPDYSQEYWRPWNNRKHVHCFTPKILKDYLTDNQELHKVFVSGVDIYNAFVCMAEKK